MKLSDKSASLFDPSLTPHNAFQKGYDYIDDVIYDHLHPSEAMLDIFSFCRQFGCRLGTPAQPNGKGEFFGLYMPK